MHNIILIAAALGILGAPQPARPYWRDMAATSAGAQTRRTEVVYFPSEKEALEGSFRASPNYLDLCGQWDFKYFDDSRDMDSFDYWSWDRIKVPGNWEVQGFGTPIYVNIPYEFRPVDPQPPTLPDVVPGAIYHRTFTVPAAWAEREVYLNLCGVKSGTYVFVNGMEAGYCEDSKNLARFDITPYIAPDRENDLVLRTYRWSAGSYLECQDFWRISGVEREVYLSSEAQDTGFDFEVVSDIAEDLTTGVLKLRLHSLRPVEVSYKLIAPDGTACAQGAGKVDGQAILSSTVPGVEPWSAETPVLYTLLLSKDGEATRFHVGFRRIRIESVMDGGREVKALLVNGEPVKFKGVNLHEHSPWTGHYVDRSLMLKDLTLMKQANINAIRTCHYPQPREFYELCDSLGFYVYDEANIESHGMGYAPARTLGNKPEWWPKHEDRILNMYRRTGSYPCVTILSLGNEAGNGVNFEKAYRLLKDLEADGMCRPVVYERAESAWNTDMYVPQYPGAEWFRRAAVNNADRPICPSEYAHAMGNSTGSLDWQWEAIYAHPNLQGGFIWDWVDQGLFDEQRGWTYGGDYGYNTPSDNNFLCNGLVGPGRDPHPGYWEVRHVYQNVAIEAVDPAQGRFAATNRYYFTTLGKFSVRWRVERDGKPVGSGAVALSTPPQGREEFAIPLPSMKKKGQYRIFFETVPSGPMPLLGPGDILATDSFLLCDTSVRKDFRSKGKVKVSDEGGRVVVKGGKAVWTFDKATGHMVSYTYKGKELLSQGTGLRPNFWRAPTDNDYGNNEPLRCLAWKDAGRKAASFGVEDLGARARVVVHYDVPYSGGVEAVYDLLASGAAKLGLRHIGLQAEGRRPVDIPRIGWRFSVDQDPFEYYGQGPWENYVDRCSGAFTSLYKTKASEQCHPYVRPQETGHHVGAQWLSVGGLTVLSDEPFEFSALRCTVEDLDSEEAAGRPYQWRNFTPDEDHSNPRPYSMRRQTHISDIPSRDFTEVCVDGAMTGVGGYDSWGSRPERARTLWCSQDYSYGVTLVPKALKKTAKAVTLNYL